MNWQDFERSVFGKASTAESGSQAPAPAQAPSPFRKNLNWIKQALGMQAGSPPQALDTNVIVSATDVLQGGWPFAISEGLKISVTAPTATGGFVLNLMTPDVTVQRVLHGLTLTNANTGAPIFAFVEIGIISGFGVVWNPVPAPPQNAGGPVIVLAPPTPVYGQATIAVGARAMYQDIFGPRPNIVIPPGMVLRVIVPADILAGLPFASFQVDATWHTIPAGFKV